MDDDHPNDRTRADVFGTAGGTLRLREGDDTSQSPDSQSREADETSDAEARMRQALGLFGTRPGGGGEHVRHHEQHSGGERRPVTSGPGARRHRFVQDGEVPVSVVRGRTGQRPQAAEGDRHADEIAHERQLRAEAERKLGEREIQLRSLQTRIGHAELERDNALAEAREWREKAEAALAAAGTAAADTAPVAADPPPEPRHDDDNEMEPPGTPGVRGARRGPRRRVDEPQLDLIDPEPVKWWL